MITIKLFGLIKTLANNQAELAVALSGGRRVQDLIATLDAQYPKIGELVHQKRVLISVNQDIAHGETEIRERALKQFDVLEVLVLHRYGEIGVGENIVLIVVGAEHRADAFKACRWCIDELKQITPIWKLEHTPAGEVWVEEHP